LLHGDGLGLVDSRHGDIDRMICNNAIFNEMMDLLEGVPKLDKVHL
jgi:hypothetical protein